MSAPRQDIWDAKPHNRRLSQLMVDIFAKGDVDQWVRLLDGIHLTRYPKASLKDRFTADSDQDTRATLIEECWMLGHRGISDERKAIYIAHAMRVQLVRPQFFDAQFKRQRDKLAPLIKAYIGKKKARSNPALIPANS